MNAELLFDLCGKLVLPAWLLLIVLPKWKWTEKIVFHAWIPSLLAIAYIYSFYSAQPLHEGSGFGSLAQVMIFFQSPYAALAGWIHYLAFDLFIGAWEIRDSRRRGINHLLVIPCLILTFLAGPVGLLLYFIIRFVKDRSLSTIEGTV
jgi:hypothetical protein